MPDDVCQLCQLCRLASELRSEQQSVTVRPGVTANSFQGGGDRPRLVLQIERHVTAFGELTADEAHNLGLAIREVAGAIESQPGVARCYVQSFNETPPGHLHVHLIPRFEDDAQPFGPLLDTAQAPASAAAFDAKSVISDLSPRPKPFVHSPVTDMVKRGLEAWNTRVSLYGAVRWAIQKTAVRERVDIGETYVLMWLILLALAVGLLTAVNSAWPAVTVLLVCLATYRWIDLVAYAGRILLTTEQSPLQSVARSLVLFGLNLVELRLIRTTWLLADGSRLSEVWHGFLGTSQASASTTLAAVGVSAVTFASALVLGLAVAMIVGKIGDTFTDTAAARGAV